MYERNSIKLIMVMMVMQRMMMMMMMMMTTVMMMMMMKKEQESKRIIQWYICGDTQCYSNNWSWEQYKEWYSYQLED